MNRSLRIALIYVFFTVLTGCVSLPDGTVVSHTVSDWVPLEPQELHGDLVNAFSGLTLQEAKRRTVYNVMQLEQVTLPGDGVITVMWLLSSHAQWDRETRDALVNQSAFQRYVQNDMRINRDPSLIVESVNNFTRIMKGPNSPNSAYGFVATATLRLPNSTIANCTTALLEYRQRRALGSQINTNDPRFLLYALFCGPRLSSAELQRRLQAVVF